MKKKEQEEQITNVITVGESTNYPKSNFIISAVYKSTLLENRVLAVALSKMNKAVEDREGSLIVQLKVDELRSKFGVTGNSIYDNLEKASRKMVGGRVIGFSDPEHNRFEYVPLLTKASYEDSTFTLRFAPEMKKYLKDLQISGSFTQLNIETMLSFESVFAFRLYEILKSKAYAPTGRSITSDTKFQIIMSLSELKLELGVVNGELAKVKAVLMENKTGSPDYDKAVEKAEEQMYAAYSEFRRVCLEPAIKEINKKTEMNVDYKPIRKGRGGKTTALEFWVTYVSKKDQAKENSDIVVEEGEFNEDDFIDAIRDTISKKIKTAEARTIAKTADFKMDVIIKADEYISHLKEEPDDYAAYMVSTIKNKWYEKVIKKDSTKKKVIDVEPEEVKPLRSEEILKKMKG